MLTFRPPAGASEPAEPFVPAPVDPGLLPESALYLAVVRAVQDLQELANRIDGGVSRSDDYRVGPADLARARRVFNEGIEALGRYQHKRRAP